ncbi:MmgE/PrpD family protein [Nitrincola alkalilacustris]|uniref:MmgE/PrpD family protein n=1 Tax=Nitrincola alkalilacustris TaxID=1571224 RepID=UPI00124EA7E1|nr:MmgE/PrpD family protein [Nitrincola alkalilacustris]
MTPMVSFIHQLDFEHLPPSVVEQAGVCLMDLLGVAVAGHGTRLSQIMEAFVCSQYPGDLPLLFSNQRASACGVALFGGTLIDSIDAHDGQALTKGHAGVALLPALVACAQERIFTGRSLMDTALTGREFVTALVLGYEIATRAGIALHAMASDYHTSGAWNALGVAAVAARLLDLDPAQTYEALGIAEFHGPRSQMMRCIEYPTMLKDGSGWGALAGMSAALLAQSGFTGSPAVTLMRHEVAPIWQDLGQRWYILEQYFKPYPVCRWAQPAVEAVRALRSAHRFDPIDIVQIHIHTFHEAASLHTRLPETTEQAQYSLPFSVACALMDDTITIQAIAETAQGLQHPLRRQLSQCVVMHEVDGYNARFPAERWAHARLLLKNGRELISKPCTARGNPENPLPRHELIDKFRSLLATSALADLSDTLHIKCLNMANLDADQLRAFLQLLQQPARL